ncbi:MAG: hypothetical protein JO310_15075 [Hyphomicrobiales bacterium]|nr:hypothetical protein [Hyphomicrobiales bacterium]
MKRGASSRARLARASRRERGIALLIGATALLLQVILSPLSAHSAHRAAPSAQLGALAELAALTGDPNVICADMNDGPQNSGPAHDKADCSGLCCHLGHGLALFLVPPSPSPKNFAGFSVRLSRAPAAFLTASAGATIAQPRGPPLSA